MDQSPRNGSNGPQGADHVVEDQGAIFAFLSSPTSHGLAAGESVRRIDTHGAVVFLAGPFAYKVKRAVYFPFMDFSTLGKRKTACTAEVAIGRANAPSIYLGVVPITRSPEGLALGGSGKPVEYAVKMSRFDPADTLDQVAARAPLERPLLTALAQAVARAHERAEVHCGHEVPSRLASYLADNRETFRQHADLFDAAEAEALAAAAEAELERITPLLRARSQAGFVRRCHGDLHLANIVLIDGAPVLFDAIEFSDDIAICDVLYDLAFLLMDLWQRGLHTAANTVLNRYLWAQRDDATLDGLDALPFFLALRASIRAKVEAAGRAHLSGAVRERAEARIRHLFFSARQFLGLAPSAPDTAPLPADFPAGLRERAPSLSAIGGLSGTGKTTRALRWAPFIGRPPGAVVLRSDIERKHLFNVAETDPLPEAAYGPEVTQQVYARLRTLAARVLATGQSAMIDAVHAHAQERNDEEALARTLKVPFHGVWLEAPLDIRVERVEHRKTAHKDASDADGEIARRQQAYDIGELNWIRVGSG